MRRAIWVADKRPLFFQYTVFVPRAPQALLRLIQLEAGVFAYIQVKLHPPALAVSKYPPSKLSSDQSFQVMEELDWKDETRMPLLVGFRRREHIMGAAVAFRYGHHPVLVANDSGFTAPQFVESPSTQFNRIIVRRISARYDPGHLR
jgi:hypothetical protein